MEVELSHLDAFSAGCATEWNAVLTNRVNVLLQGPRHATQAVIALLTPHLMKPIIARCSEDQGELPTGPIRVLVLEDVEALSAESQMRLLGWLDLSMQHTQIVSTTSSELYTRVSRGLFAAALYYRLNIMHLCVR